MESGKAIRTGKVSLDIEPQGSKEINVPVNGLKAKPGVEYFVNFSVTTVTPEQLIPVGHEIAYDQFRLPIEPLKQTYATNGPALKIETAGDQLMATSSKVNFTFNKQSGLVTSYPCKRNRVLQRRIRHTAQLLESAKRQRLW